MVKIDCFIASRGFSRQNGLAMSHFQENVSFLAWKIGVYFSKEIVTN